VRIFWVLQVLIYKVSVSFAVEIVVRTLGKATVLML